ncbi:hypothetical protein [Winogradskya humida]|uniref:Soluble lytic murein transglycosylase-like protein n=1 Tax=Winogradskya humida TaxID=113566 RepID=A0ABQ3ZP92_9ACTN|nr:hypothetical protein [Actinoplanes humidus]GIE20367.1 hypothetical protein Ahu01nite_034690 [Actinoplanes humidus]
MWPFKKLAFDPTFGDPAARAIAAAGERGDWATVRDGLTAVTDWDQREFYLCLAVEREGPQPWIDDWIKAEPKSALPYLAKGRQQIVYAWEARSTKLAKDVSQDQFAVFFRRLKLAEDALDEAATRDRDSPIAWSQRVVTAMGRQLGVGEARHRFSEATARDRWNRGAHRNLLNQLHEKWSGQEGIGVEFARQTVEDMPDGSELGVLVPEAYLQHAGRHDEGIDYLRRTGVIAELYAAGGKSVRHPAFQRRPGYQAAEGYFALAFVLAGEFQAAATHLDAIGDLPAEDPWDTVRAYRGFRREVYSRVGR